MTAIKQTSIKYEPYDIVQKRLFKIKQFPCFAKFMFYLRFSRILTRLSVCIRNGHYALIGNKGAKKTAKADEF